MNRLAKIWVLAATSLALAFGSLAQVSAAPLQGKVQNYTYGQSDQGVVQQVRHKRHHHYHNRHHHYKKQRKHRSNRYCRYSPRHGTMMCRPHHHHRH